MKSPFDYQKPSEENVKKIEVLRESYKKLHAELLELGAGREIAIAITNLEQSAQWAIKHLVFNAQ